MRISPVALLFPLAFILASAAPSSEVRDKARRAVYQAQALAFCQIGMAQRRPGDFEAGDAAQGCRCTVDAFMTGKSVARLPPLDASSFRTIVKAELAQCLDSMAKIGVKRRVPESAIAAPAPSAVPVPDSQPAAGTEAAPALATPGTAPAAPTGEYSGPTRASAADWLDWVPLWVWGALGLAVLLFAARKLAGRGQRRDLMGVPQSMRSRLPGQPRRPDLPRS
jgi:hypothetical protein